MQTIVPPTECPSCLSTLERVNAQLFCRNKECPAQFTKKLQNFCKKLKLKGFGEVTLNKLDITTINQLFELDSEYAQQKGFSEHMSDKLVGIVSSKLEDGIQVGDFIAACSIPLIGDSVGRKLNTYKVEEITEELCDTLGIGEKAKNSLLSWIRKEYPLYSDTWGSCLVTSSKPKIVETKSTVCITGKLNDFPNRKAATEYLESLGYTVKSSVTKSVEYLINEDGTKGSSYTKAISYNIKIVTIKELIEDK